MISLGHKFKDGKFSLNRIKVTFFILIVSKIHCSMTFFLDADYALLVDWKRWNTFLAWVTTNNNNQRILLMYLTLPYGKRAAEFKLLSHRLFECCICCILPTICFSIQCTIVRLADQILYPIISTGNCCLVLRKF